MKWAFYNPIRVRPPGRSNNEIPNKGTSKYMKQKMTEMKREIDSSTIIVVTILPFNYG